jgi:hypothetical protein
MIMQYMLIYREGAEHFAERQHPEKSTAYWGAWMAYIGAMRESGITISGYGLQPPQTATMVTVRNGARHVQDGPYADSKEQLGGYFIIEVPDLDTAIEWAARSPASVYGSTEIRPVLPPPPQAG